MNRHHVAFCCSGESGLKYLSVAGLSLWSTHSQPHKLHLHLVWENIDEQELAKLRRSWSEYEGQFDFHRLSDHIGEEALDPGYGYWFRIWLAHILPQEIDRVLYLDYDMLVYQDVSPLWEVDLAGHAAGVVWDPAYRIYGLSRRLSAQAAEHGLEFGPDDPYFNSGFLLINLHWWRAADAAQTMTEAYKDHRDWFVLHDQTELNLFLRGKVKPLSPRWNLLEPLRLYRDWDYEIYSEYDPGDYFYPAIRHFSGEFKPDRKMVRSSEKSLFYAYLDRTEWAGWRSENDKTWLGRQVSQLLEFHYLICRGLLQGHIPDWSAKLGRLIRSNPLLPLFYAAVPFHRLRLNLRERLQALKERLAPMSFQQHAFALLSVIYKNHLPGPVRRALTKSYCLARKETGGKVPIPPFLQPRIHSYVGHEGPWIEDYLERYLASLNRSDLGRTYLPLRWTDYYVRFGFQPQAELQDFLDLTIDPGKSYFTVVQGDVGILNELPDNVLVFSAGSHGGLPIPLLKGSMEYSFDPRKDYKVSFQGNLATTSERRIDVRQMMVERLAHEEGFHFFEPNSGGDFHRIVTRSEFVLCPRGYGCTSFRLYEAMSLGAIPIYIWEEVEWLPYREEIDWDQLIISLHYDRISDLPDIIRNMSPAEVAAKQNAIRSLHDRYFTLDGVCRYIVDYLDRESAQRLKNRQSDPPAHSVR